MDLPKEAAQKLDEILSRHGQRMTKQREQVYAAIYENKNHPTADDVYGLVKKSLPTISLATVYNCLETLVECGLVKEVNMGRSPTRYDWDSSSHGHFFCHDCGEVFDIKLSNKFLDELKNILPEGFNAESVQLNFKGVADCHEDAEQCEELAIEKNLTSTPLR